jgi:hypothetical protein
LVRQINQFGQPFTWIAIAGGRPSFRPQLANFSSKNTL